MPVGPHGLSRKIHPTRRLPGAHQFASVRCAGNLSSIAASRRAALATMSRITITCSAGIPVTVSQVFRGDHGELVYGFMPRFQARQGSPVLLSASVQLTHYASDLAVNRLQALALGEATPVEALGQLLVRYGARLMEASVREMQADGLQPDPAEVVWKLSGDDLEDLYLLLPLVGSKSCAYQQPIGRDLMCTAAAPSDQTASQTWNGRLIAPTSRAVCGGCDLPESDVLCSNLLHPSVKGDLRGTGLTMRHVLSAMCDLGREEVVEDISRCRAGGHACWERHVTPEPAAAQPVSPIGLPEQFDVLDAYWRLRFGSRQHLIDLHTVTGAASLALGCGSRADFESRLSALADIIDRLVVDDALLPTMTEQEKKEKIKGSLDKLQVALLHQLPAHHHAGIERAILTLRKLRQARNAIQHGTARDGGLTARLREAGIHDAPPNWAGAWDILRVQVSNAVSGLRNELRSAIDAAP
jgi:hypothetical protein